MSRKNLKFTSAEVFKVLVLLVTTGQLSACRMNPPMPQDNFYHFAAAPTVERFAEPLLAGKLYVELPRAIGVRRSRAMLYSDDPDQLRLRQYHYHHWEEAPARLIRRRLSAALTQSGAAAAVATDQRHSGDYVLRTELRRFERMIARGQVEAMVEINARLGQGRAGEWVFERDYQQRVAARSETMLDTVNAFTAAVDQIIADLLRDLPAIADRSTELADQ